MKRFIVLLIAAILCLSVGIVLASEIRVNVDGRKLSPDVSPQIVNGRTLVPARAIFEALGVSVTWNDGTVTGVKDGTTVRFTVGSRELRINEIIRPMDVAPAMVNDRVLVPVRFVSEAFGAAVSYREDTRTVNIVSPKGPEDKTIVIDGDVYRQTFFDGFDDFDETKWSPCPPQQRGSVGGWWDESQIRVENGNLILSATKNDAGVPLTGAIRTRRKFEQCRGYFEARCKVQRAEGFWSSFWLYTNCAVNVGNGATDGVELDVFEAFDRKNGGLDHMIHWDTGAEVPLKTGFVETRPECYEGFHTYGVLWTDTAYVFYVDGEPTYRLGEGDEAYPGSCEEEVYLLLSVIAGTWSGTIRDDEIPDDALTVDYVCVYEKENK